jgi:hypothetical protein
MTMTIKTKTIDTLRFRVHTQQSDIDGGKCGRVQLCMEKIAVERALRKLDPKGGDHKVRIDAGILKFKLGGYRWTAITAKQAKRALILFDKERKARAKAERLGQPFVSKVKPHAFQVEAHKGMKIQQNTRERKDQINAARRKRVAEGKPDKRSFDLRYRIEGLGSV